jgi:hypothetical protein
VPGKSDLIVVGPAPGSGQLAAVAGRLPIAISDSVGTLQQTEMSTGDGQVLWVGGGKETLNAAARALTNVQLRGHAVTVDAAGHVQAASSVSSPGGQIASFGLPKLLAVLAGVVLALTLGLQLVRPRRKVAI